MEGITRREMLALAGLGQAWTPDFRRYLDGATEFPVLRLTDPAYESRLPGDPARVFGKHSDVLYFASTRDGAWQLFRLEFKTGQVKQLTEATELDPAAFTISPDERWLVYWDGPRLMAANLGNLKAQVVTELGTAVTHSGSPAFSDDGTFLFWIDGAGGNAGVTRMNWPKGPQQGMLGVDYPAVEVHPNPKRGTLFVVSPGGLVTLAAYDGKQKRRLTTPSGTVLQAAWDADGQDLLYLLKPDEPGKLVMLREYDIDTKADRLVAPTTQFARFARNANGTVFIGASALKASPMVLLLLRVNKRELTLCEHKASIPAATHPLFSPNSQRIVFQSDREGKAALYSMMVDKQVEKTES